MSPVSLALLHEGAALVAGEEHGDPFGDAGADQGAGGGAATIVEEAGRHAGRLTGRAPRRCCMNTRCGWGGVARTSRDPPQEPHYGDAVEGSSQV